MLKKRGILPLQIFFSLVLVGRSPAVVQPLVVLLKEWRWTGRTATNYPAVLRCHPGVNG